MDGFSKVTGQAIGALVAISIAIGGVYAAGSEAHAVAQPAAATTTVSHAGGYRWDVKTLADPAARQFAGLAPTDTSIQSLAGLAGPPLHSPRSGAELQTWRLSGVTLLAYGVRHDGDIHLVLGDAAGRTLVAEMPAASSMTSAPPALRAQADAARAQFEATHSVTPGRHTLSEPVSVAGVGFFDFTHPKPVDGAAPNGIELHPVLAFQAL